MCGINVVGGGGYPRLAMGHAMYVYSAVHAADQRAREQIRSDKGLGSRLG